MAVLSMDGLHLTSRPSKVSAHSATLPRVISLPELPAPLSRVMLGLFRIQGRYRQLSESYYSRHLRERLYQLYSSLFTMSTGITNFWQGVPQG